MYKTLNDINLQNRRVLIREDLNVPIKNGTIISDARIQAALPTIQYALSHNAKIILLSHLGRPVEGEYTDEYSLRPVAEYLSKELNKPVSFLKNWLTEPINIQAGEVALCENVRFNKGEKSCDKALSKKMAALCDVFVMDAFATAHRKHASTYGVAQYAKEVCAGKLLDKELKALNRALKNPKRPLVAIVGGAKVSSKLSLLSSLLEKVDYLILGGGIANTFMASQHLPIGNSLHEPELIQTAGRLFKKANTSTEKIILPCDVVVGKAFDPNESGIEKNFEQIENDDLILDVGTQTIKLIENIIQKAGTLLWNGPLGVFEFNAFSKGTQALAVAVAKSDAFSIAGGGDTIAAIEKYNVKNSISYISTGGGAFLSYLEGKPLPGVAALSRH